MAKAILKFIRLSPTKARLIAREVQGMNAEYAIASLQFTPNKAAGIISKVIASAVIVWEEVMKTEVLKALAFEK